MSRRNYLKFLLRIETVGALRAGYAVRLYIFFETALEERLKSLALLKLQPLTL